MQRWEWKYSAGATRGFELVPSASKLPNPGAPATRWNRKSKAPREDDSILRVVGLITADLETMTSSGTLRAKGVQTIVCTAEMAEPLTVEEQDSIGQKFSESIREGINSATFSVGGCEFTYQLLTSTGELCKPGEVYSKSDRKGPIPESVLDAALAPASALERAEARLLGLEKDIAPARKQIVDAVQEALRGLGKLKPASVDEGRAIAASINELLAKLGLRVQVPEGPPGFLGYEVAGGTRGGGHGFVVRLLGQSKRSLFKSGFENLIVVESPPDQRRGRFHAHESAKSPGKR